MKLNNSINTYKILLTILLIASFVITFFPVWERLAMSWYLNDDNSHGFFIIPLCIFIIWQKKDVIAANNIKPSRWGLIWIILSLSLYLLAHFAEIVTLSSFSMVMFLASVIIYLFGFGVLKELFFPFFLLFFMIPVPAQIYAILTNPLQLFVSKISTWVAYQFGLPVYREGNVIYLPGYTLQVVEACSGLRSMISLLVLSAVFGYFTLKSKILRTVLFLSGLPAAIIINIFRVVVLILISHYLNYDLSKGTNHTLFGVAIFFLGFMIIALTKGVLSVWENSSIKI